MTGHIVQATAGDGLGSYLVGRLGGIGVSGHEISTTLAYHSTVEANQPFSRTIVELGLAADETVALWVATFLGWRLVPRERLVANRELRRVLPGSIARNRKALVLSHDEQCTTVAVADPTWPQFAQVRYALESCNVEWVVAPQADISAAVAEVYTESFEMSDNELERFVEEMIRRAAHTKGLSDIHFIPEDRCCEIRWRIDGELIPWGTLPASLKDAVTAQIKLSSTRGIDGRQRETMQSGGLDVANKFEAQDASAVREYGSKRISLRYSVVPGINGESIVIRVLDQCAQAESLSGIGMLSDTAVRFRSVLKLTNGIVLISGPTGHGKSTTLASAVPLLDTHRKRVLSIEDPVEYRLRMVTQAPVTPRLTFASALRAFLRHNPDIVIVGEIRDSETAELALRMALTGHLILATIHANSAVQSVCRMIDLGGDAALMAATMKMLMAQRLVRRLCVSCRRIHHNNQKFLAEHGPILESALSSGLLKAGENLCFHEAGGGCELCKGTGFSGRIGIFEQRLGNGLLETSLLEERERFNAVNAERHFADALASGDLTARGIRLDGIFKAAQGMTSLEEVYAATANPLGTSQ
ncbi:MAG TPA: GspE/PulE family protein [Opitutaceae bacterium]|jgi:type II secretory ATPase GspE/PulE/Tfp pilus assembly ATPase PilB-like protein